MESGIGRNWIGLVLLGGIFLFSSCASPEAAALKDKPNAPQNLSAVAITSTEIDLTWEEAKGSSVYLIERRDPGAQHFVGISAVGGEITQFEDFNVKPGKEYFYRIRARNSFGHSHYSNEALAETEPPPPGAPAAPEDLTAMPKGSTQIDLQWEDRSNNETLFRIERKMKDEPWSLLVEVASPDSFGMGPVSYLDEGLLPRTTYLYRVLAKNEIGTSLPSNEESATTEDPPPQAPEAPTELKAKAVLDTSGELFALEAGEPDYIRLTWKDNADDESHFMMERKIENGNFKFLGTVLKDMTEFKDFNVARGITYTYRIYAVNSIAPSSSSNEASVSIGLLIP